MQANIYRYKTDAGETYYAVCHWVESAGQYEKPLNAQERRLTGCHTEFARTPQRLGRMTRGQAYYQARARYGYAKIEAQYV